MPIPTWIPAESGERHPLRWVAARMPLLRNGGLHVMESALWLPNHAHAWWELHYLHRGRMDLELSAGRRTLSLAVPGGHFVLTRPRRVHRARDGIMGACQVVWLQFDPGRADAMRGTPFTRSDLRRLAATCAARADSAWPASPEADAAYRRLRELLAGGTTPGKAAAVRLAVAELLLQAMAPPAAAEEPPALARALAALAEDPARPCTVAAAAARAGISSGRLHALCARHRGTTPAAWQLARRLAAARAPLAAGEAVAAVAARLGFSSPRYFAFAFRREVGVPPSLYAAASRDARRGPPLAW